MIQEFRHELEKALKVLREGGIIAYPTDTIWGLGCDATNEEAASRLFQLKERESSHPMLALVDSTEQLRRWVDFVPPIAEEVISTSTEPLTVILDNPIGIAANIIGADGSMGFRITHEPFSNALCKTLRRPVVSTSANISGCPPAKCRDDISDEILKGVDYAVEWGTLIGKDARPSHIIKFTCHDIFKIIR